MHETALIATIAAGLGLAFVLGFVAVRLRLPPLVGYLLAGVLVGPSTPGFIADAGMARQLAEIGVILLMFGVGIHFSPGDLLSVRRIAVPGAIVQILVATALGAAMTRLWGWSWGSGIVFGLCLSVASTVVLLRALEDRRMLDSEEGRIAVGWLIVEDLVTVVVLVLLPITAFAADAPARDDGAGAGEIAAAFLLTLAKVAAFVVLMAVVGRRAVPWILARVAKTGSRELFTLSVLAVALGIAVGASAMFGVSFALGAFFAGMVVNGSDLSHEAAHDSLPLQDAFSVLFFVAVGMLFDPAILVEHPLRVLGVVLTIMVGKSVAAFLIVLVFRETERTAYTISASLAQIGEFSFILAGLGVSLELLPEEGQSLVVAGALISITLNPLAFALARRLGARSARGQVPIMAVEETLRGHAVLVGYGRVGSVIGETLKQRFIPYVVIERNQDIVEALRAQGARAIAGDATREEVLRQACVHDARLLVVAAPDPYQARAIIEAARRESPKLDVVVRTHSEAERTYLERHGAGLAFVGEHELALALAHYSLLSMGIDDDRADETVDALRRKRPHTQPPEGIVPEGPDPDALPHPT